MSAAAITGSTMTHDGFAGGNQIHGIGGVAVRVGRASNTGDAASRSR